MPAGIARGVGMSLERRPRDWNRSYEAIVVPTAWRQGPAYSRHLARPRIQLLVEVPLDNTLIFVHGAFMSPAPTAPVESAPPHGRQSPAPKPSRAAALLHFIRVLIDTGRDHLAAVRSQPGPEQAQILARRFGTFNLSLIVVRILRGLRLAAALEQRVIANTQGIDAPPCVRAAASAPRRSGVPRKQKQPEDAGDDALLARAPTDREIAEMVRGRAIGAVLVDICADLGIGVGHPLWHDLQSFIIDHDGPVEKALMRGFQRFNDARLAVEQGLVPDGILYSYPEQIPGTTGPPLLLAAA